VLYAGESYPGAPSSLSYNYLPDGRLGQYGVSQGAVTYFNYDHDGNRTAWNPSYTTTGTVVSTYNPDDSLKQTRNNSGSVNVVYDAAGRMMADGCTTYTYDGFDRMTAANAVTSSRPAECGTLPGGASTATSYSYDALDRQTVVWDGSGPWTRHFSTMGTEVGVTQYSCCTTQHDRWMVNDNGGTPSQVVDIQSSGTTQWLWNNGQGNLGEVTTSTGATACLLQYDLNGGALFGTSPTNACISGGGQLTNLGYKFASRDATTGDYTFGKRTYDPSKGAFATPDSFSPGTTARDLSIGTDPLTQDVYSYVNGDPVNRIDPTGHRYTTGNDSVDSGASGSCDTCLIQPTHYVQYTSHGATCNAACRGEMQHDRARAVVHDDLTKLQGYMQQQLGQYRQEKANFMAGRETAGQPPGPFDGTVDQGCQYVQSGDVRCPDDNGKYTLTPEQYAPHANIDWGQVGLTGLLTVGTLLVGEIPGLDVGAAAALASRFGLGAVERVAADEGGGIVYRGLAEGEDAAVGLVARNPNAGNDIVSHIAGLRDSQWISTTKSLEIAQEQFGEFGIVRIDLSKVASKVVDASAGIPGMPSNYMLSRWAQAAQEVLIQGSVPKDAIELFGGTP
jgi:RHS repeat-associated protein